MNKNKYLNFLRFFNGFINEFILASIGFVPILAIAIDVWGISSYTAPYWPTVEGLKKVLTEEDHKKLGKWAGNLLQNLL